MTLTIGSFSTNNLTAQPLGYDGSSPDGLTARRWRIAGLLSSHQWDALVGVYEHWRDARITDQDTLSTANIGTTVSFSGTGFGSTGSWSTVPCWFASPPSADQVGAYVSATAELVDARQSLEVLLRQKEKERQNVEDHPNLGIITIAQVDLKPIDPPYSRTDVPVPTLTAAGHHYLSGAFSSTQTRRIRAYVTSTEYTTLLDWFDSKLKGSPVVDEWWPIGFPEPTVEYIIKDGVKIVRYTIEMSFVKIR
jgi:hypothetical protein